MRDAVAAAAPSLGLALVSAEAAHIADYEREITAFAEKPDGGLVVLSNGVAIRHPEEIHALAARWRLPAVYSYPIYAKTGGLISYGTDPVAQFPEAARYVDRILRGTKPGELPVQQPTKFELVINLKTAKALGLIVPQSILARADEVIE
jgi:putative ABC transport system substrate-binding protein